MSRLFDSYDFKVGDKVRLSFSSYLEFNGVLWYEVVDHHGILAIYDNNNVFLGLKWAIDSNQIRIDAILRLNDKSEKHTLCPEQPLTSKEEPSEHERLMSFFKASAHDKNAKW